MKRRIRLSFSLFINLFFCLSAISAQHIENNHFRVIVDQELKVLEVLDKTNGHRWVQTPTQTGIQSATTEGGILKLVLEGGFLATVECIAEGLNVSIQAGDNTSTKGLDWPSGFRLRSQAKSQKLVLPNCAGLVIPFEDRAHPMLSSVLGNYETWNNQRGLSMPWIGVTDGEAASCMLIESPFDVLMHVSRDNRGYTYNALWLDSKGAFSYERRILFEFLTKGGAVGLCKRYRQHAKTNGLLVTLKEKEKNSPQIRDFVGAMSFWIVDWPDIGLLKKMKSDGIGRALISFHSTQNIPDTARDRIGCNTTYEPMTGEFVETLHNLGYLAGRYDYYRTIYPPNDPGLLTGEGNLWIMRKVGYPEQLALDEEGRIVPGFGARPENGEQLIRGHRCSKCQAEMASVYIPVDVARTPYDARLLDALCAVEWKECYSSDHPVTRKEDMLFRLQQMAVSTECHQMTGTEGLASWAVPQVVYAEGPTTFARFFKRPTGPQLKPVYREIDKGYREVVLNEKYRFPLWQLVFHDATVITNRWNITANRYIDLDLWDREDLFNLLHGQMPTFLIDEENYSENSERFLRTFQMVCEWNQKIAYEEMTNFEWLTEDGSIQQTIYESGHKVIVNFGNTEYRTIDGRIIPRYGYEMFNP